MDLMPHIKALLDDLIGITKNITVKRADIAGANEGSSADLILYEQYKKVINNDLTFSSYTKSQLPYGVLSSIYKWTKLPYSINYKLCAYDKTAEFRNGDNKIIIFKDDLTNGYPPKKYLSKSGDIYIYQYRSGSYKKLVKREQKFRNTQILLCDTDLKDGYTKDDDNVILDLTNSNYGIYRIKSNSDIANKLLSLSLTLDNDSKITFYDNSNNEIKLYVYDNQVKSYKEVHYKYEEEYIKKEDALLEIDNLILQSPELKEKAEKIYGKLAADITNEQILYIYYGGYADPNYQENELYKYDVIIDNNNNIATYVEYVYDNSYGGYRVKQPDDSDGLTVYYRRSFDEYYLVDYNDEYVYYPKNIRAPYYCTLDDAVDYYKVRIPLIDDDGNYVRDENGYIQTKLIDMYEPKENLGDLIEDGDIVYSRYKNNKPGLIDFSLEYTNNLGETVRKYKIDTSYSDEENNVIVPMIYRFTDNEYKQVLRCIDRSSSSYTNYEYFIPDNELGIYIKQGDDYIIPSDPSEYTEFYSLVTTTDPYIYNYDKDNEIYNCGSYISGNSYIYYNPNIHIFRVDRAFTDEDIENIWSSKLTIPEEYQDDITKKYSEYIKQKYAPYLGDKRWSVTRYDGETNSYYRALNGLPPYDTNVDQPKIDRYKINENYSGTDPNPYVYNLSDDEIEIISKNGMLEHIQKLNPAKEYLWHLGRNRIDVIVAREAAPFEILEYGEYVNEEHFDMFVNAYRVSKNYIIHNHYQPEMFDVNPYYGSYIAMIILVNALDICMAKSGDILIHNKYADYETVQLKLKSYGFENTFDHIPLIYRKNIAKNLELLIRNKGIDSIYDIVYKIFNIDDVEVFKYYFRKIYKRDENGYIVTSDGKPEYDLMISQVPISSENTVRDILNTDNSIDYDQITENDRYWGVYETKESIKNMLNEYPFNYMNSKYITLNNKFNLSQLNFNASYYLNYVYDILDSLGSGRILLKIDGFDEPIDLKDLIVMLFAIQSIKFGFDGNIPSDLVASAAVLKFNLNEEVTITGPSANDIDSDGHKKSKLIDIIDSYYNHMTNRETITDEEKSNWNDNDELRYETEDKLSTVNETEKYWRGKGKAANIKKNILNPPKPPIVLPNTSGTFKLLDDISNAFLDNLKTDNILSTNTDEGSLFNTILRYRDDAKTHNDYRCFNDLAKIIATSKIVRDVYKIDNVWEEVAEVPLEVDSSTEKMVYKFDDATWDYVNLEKIWTKIDDPFSDKDFKDFFRKFLIDGRIDSLTKSTEDGNIYWCVDVPLINKLVDDTIKYAINIGDTTRKAIIEFNFSGCLEDNNETSLATLFKTFDKFDVYKKSTLFTDDLDIEYDSVNAIWDTKGFVDKLNNKGLIEDAVVSNGFSIVYGAKHPDEYNFNEIENFKLKHGTYYIQTVEKNSGEKCIMKIYQYTDYAFTYAMYLKYTANDLYDYLQKRDGEENSDYIERLNELYSVIIATIENAISSNATRDKLNLSLIDFANIAKYIKIIIEVFKSYTVDLASMDAIYIIDDKSNNRIKTIDGISIDDHSFMSSNVHGHSMVSFEESFDATDRILMRDEILIEQY